MGLNQEYLEFALFQDALTRFSDADWRAAGFTPDDQYLVQYMLEQEIGHIDLITNILGGPGEYLVFQSVYAVVNLFDPQAMLLRLATFHSLSLRCRISSTLA